MWAAAINHPMLAGLAVPVENARAPAPPPPLARGALLSSQPKFVPNFPIPDLGNIPIDERAGPEAWLGAHARLKRVALNAPPRPFSPRAAPPPPPPPPHQPPQPLQQQQPPQRTPGAPRLPTLPPLPPPPPPPPPPQRLHSGGVAYGWATPCDPAARLSWRDAFSAAASASSRGRCRACARPCSTRHPVLRVTSASPFDAQIRQPTPSHPFSLLHFFFFPFADSFLLLSSPSVPPPVCVTASPLHRPGGGGCAHRGPRIIRPPRPRGRGIS